MKLEKIKKFFMSLTMFLFPIFLMGKTCVPYVVLSYGVLIHLFFYISFFIILLALTRKANKSFIILNIVEFIFFTISYLKLEIRSQLFEPWDFLFVKNIGEFFEILELTQMNCLKIFVEFCIGIIITLYQCLIFEKYCKIPEKKKLIPMSIVLILVTLFFTMKYVDIEKKYLYSNTNGTRNFSVVRPLIEYGGLWE